MLRLKDRGIRTGLTEAVSQARRLLEEAELRAQAIAETKAVQAELAIADAKKAGYAAGKEEVVKNCLGTEIFRKRILSESRKAILELVFSLAEEVVGEALVIQPEALLKRIARALKQAQNARNIRLCLHPADVAFVRNRLSKLDWGGPAFDLCEDANVAQGAARIETETHSISASTEEHLQALETAIRESEEQLFQLVLPMASAEKTPAVITVDTGQPSNARA